MIKKLTVMLVVAVLTATAFAFDDNPYCGKTPESFPPPFSQPCPDGTSPDYVEQAICKEDYKKRMVEIYDEACNAYTKAEKDRRICLTGAIQVYDACKEIQPIEVCRQKLLDAIDECDKKFEQTKVRIVTTLNSKRDIAKGAYLKCMEESCK